MKSVRLSQIVFVLVILLSCGMGVSAGEETTRVEVRKASFEPFPGAEEVPAGRFGHNLYLAPDAIFVNSDFAAVRAVGDLRGKPGLELILNDDAAIRMRDLSSQWIGKPMAILINGEVLLAPVVRAVLSK